MDGSAVPLQIFGPEALHRWLYMQWYSYPGLTEETKVALQNTHNQLQFLKQPKDVEGHILTVVDYVKILQALSLEDFVRFIDWSLVEHPFPPQWKRPPVLIDHEGLDIPLVALRQRLFACFTLDELWPKEGFRPLLHKAEEMIHLAQGSVIFADTSIHHIERIKAGRDVHDGLDRSLLYVERFLELLVEFFALLAFHVERANLDDIDRWLKEPVQNDKTIGVVK